MMKFFIKNKIILPVLFFATIFVNTNIAMAAASSTGTIDNSISNQLIVCNGVGDASSPNVDTKACTFDDAMKLLQNVIKLLLTKVAFLIFMAGMFYGGWMFLTSGGDIGARKKAKNLIWRMIIGYVIALASWVIIKAVITIFAGETPSFDTFF